jgi:hypothetical protein
MMAMQRAVPCQSSKHHNTRKTAQEKSGASNRETVTMKMGLKRGRPQVGQGDDNLGPGDKTEAGPE